MNRRGTVLVTVLLALLLTGALATAALAAARLRHLAGLRAMAAARASLLVDRRLEIHRAALDPVAAESLTIGVPVPLAEGDTLRRLGASLYQLRVLVEVQLATGSVVARDGAAQLLELLQLCSPAALLQSPPGMTDGRRSSCVSPVTISRFRRVPGGWWRVT